MNRRIAAVALAVLLALTGTVAVYLYVRGADDRALAKTDAVNVVITDKRIPAHTAWEDVLAGDYLHEDKLPAESVPADAITDLKAPIPDDEVAGADIAAGMVVVRQMFGEKTSVTGVLAIPKGKIAVTVSMSRSADVAGFVQPSSEVAIFGTFEVRPGQRTSTRATTGIGDDDDLWVTKLILPRIEVLATSQGAPGDVNGGKDRSASTRNSDVYVTLALTQREAERVILAQEIGKLYLALLSDTSVTKTDGGVMSVGRFEPTPIFVR